MKTDVTPFDTLLPQVQLYGYRFLIHSPDCSHEIWRRFSHFITLPTQCKSPHTVQAIRDLMAKEAP